MKSLGSVHSNRFFEDIQVDMYSSTPKYLQLAHSILNAIESGKIRRNILLPSLNELTYNLEISRETADKGYKYLQSLGVLNAIPGKGHYVIKTQIKQELKICLMINKISDEKKQFYDAFVASLGADVPIDFYIYNSDFLLFKKLFQRKSDYSHYLIMPHFTDNTELAEVLINTIEKEKLILLDKKLDGVKGKHGAVVENFRSDIYHALEKALEPLSKYHTLKLIFPESGYYPEEIEQGFTSFCLEYAFDRKVLNAVEDDSLQSGEAYVCLTEESLISLLEKAEANNLVIGKDIGVISYNESPMKRIILDGITTISTDYTRMGQLAAEMIKTGRRDHIELPFSVNLRPSL